MSTQMCVNCGENPAVPGDGKTLPLCSSCGPRAGSSRGVTMTPPKPKPGLDDVVQASGVEPE
jgi:hypothetical protein